MAGPAKLRGKPVPPKGAGARPAGKESKKGVHKPANRPRKEKKEKKSIHNVYEDSEDDRPVLKDDGEDNYQYELPSDFDDEEIDEDEAFTAEDFERYGDIGPGKKKQAAAASNHAPSDEEFSDSNDEGDDDEMDLSELLGGTKQRKDKDILGKAKPMPFAESDEDDEGAGEGSDDDARHAGLLQAIGALDGKGKGRYAMEQTEMAQEGEFGVGKSKVRLADLIASLKDTTGFGGLKKQLAGLSEATALSIPMAKPAKERINRSAAFEEAKDDISKWTGVVKRNREAEHLSFPMNAPQAPAHSNASLTVKFKPETPMEHEIAVLLENAGDLDGAAAAQGQLLDMAELSVDEMRERQKQLAKMRALMSYYELKRQRINKIKSKTYHRKLKKEKERKQMQLGEMGLLDHESLAAEQEKAERARAEERMTLRHKNTSKWAKRLLQRNSLDPKSRAALEEQLRLGQQLRQKITLEKGSGDEDDSEDEDGEDATGSEDDEGGASANRSGASRARQLTRKLQQLEESLESPLPSTGLLGMKFMQRALEKQRQQAQREIEEVKRQLEEEAGASGSDAESDSEESGAEGSDSDDGDHGLAAGEVQSHKVAHSRGHGTAVSGFVSIDLDADEPLFEVTEMDEGGASLDVNKSAVRVETSDESESEDDSAGEEDGSESEGENGAGGGDNPWISLGAEKKKAKAQPQGRGKIQQAKSESILEEAASSESNVAPKSPQERGTKRKADLVVPASSLDAADHNDDDDGEFDLARGDEEQRRLIERAFANDNVVEAFEAEKAEEMEADEEGRKPKAEPVLPGWGAWAGEGVKAKPRAPKAPEKPAAPAVPRKDANLPHVIINEKRDKKAAAKLVKSLPHGFETRDQYERAIRNPVGREWNTPSVVERNIKPKISTKAGAVIAPISMNKEVKIKKAEAKEKRQRIK